MQPDSRAASSGSATSSSSEDEELRGRAQARGDQKQNITIISASRFLLKLVSLLLNLYIIICGFFTMAPSYLWEGINAGLEMILMMNFILSCLQISGIFGHTKHFLMEMQVASKISCLIINLMSMTYHGIKMHFIDDNEEICNLQNRHCYESRNLFSMYWYIWFNVLLVIEIILMASDLFIRTDIDLLVACHFIICSLKNLKNTLTLRNLYSRWIPCYTRSTNQNDQNDQLDGINVETETNVLRPQSPLPDELDIDGDLPEDFENQGDLNEQPTSDENNEEHSGFVNANEDHDPVEDEAELEESTCSSDLSSDVDDDEHDDNYFNNSIRVPCDDYIVQVILVKINQEPTRDRYEIAYNMVKVKLMQIYRICPSEHTQLVQDLSAELSSLFKYNYTLGKKMLINKKPPVRVTCETIRHASEVFLSLKMLRIVVKVSGDERMKTLLKEVDELLAIAFNLRF